MGSERCIRDRGLAQAQVGHDDGSSRVNAADRRRQRQPEERMGLGAMKGQVPDRVSLGNEHVQVRKDRKGRKGRKGRKDRKDRKDRQDRKDRKDGKDRKGRKGRKDRKDRKGMKDRKKPRRIYKFFGMQANCIIFE